MKFIHFTSEIFLLFCTKAAYDVTICKLPQIVPPGAHASNPYPCERMNYLYTETHLQRRREHNLDYIADDHSSASWLNFEFDSCLYWNEDALVRE